VSAAQRPVTALPEAPGQPQRGKPRRRRKKVLAVAVVAVVLAGAGAGVGLARPFGGRPHPSGGVPGNGAATSLAAVTRQSLSSRTSVNGTLGYAGSYTVINRVQGTFTALPAAGRVIRQGQVLYRVDGKPVVLLYGQIPAYRSLAEGTTASDVTGRDVAQLNRDLVDLGYASRSQLDPSSDEFSWATKAALERLQKHLGVAQTGKLALGDVVFLPRAARITKVQPALGTQAGSGSPVLAATSTARWVSIDLDAALQSEVNVGDKVTIALPGGTTTPGRVTSVGKVASAASASATPTVPVEVAPLHPAATGSLDQAPVHVSITTATVRDALVVPVAALLALASGGYAVEEVAPRGVHRLVPVQLGMFDDAAGLVQVTGSGLVAGQRVVVPAS
jgi:Putative peptidoglycan binding domain